MATEIKKLRPESIRTTGASANDVLTISGGDTVFANELSLSGLNIGTSDSLAGLILEHEGKIPKIGDIIKIKNFTLQIEEVDLRRIKRIKVSINEI